MHRVVLVPALHLARRAQGEIDVESPVRLCGGDTRRAQQGHDQGASHSYSRSRMSLYFFSTTLRFTLRLGVSSPASTERSCRQDRELLIVS